MEAKISYEDKGKYYLTCTNQGNAQSYIDVPIWFYDNYHAYKSDGEELLLDMGENNKIRVYIPGNFEGTICLRYEVPGIWRLCEIISCITACAIITRFIHKT